MRWLIDANEDVVEYGHTDSTHRLKIQTHSRRYVHLPCSLRIETLIHEGLLDDTMTLPTCRMALNEGRVVRRGAHRAVIRR